MQELQKLVKSIDPKELEKLEVKELQELLKKTSNQLNKATSDNKEINELNSKFQRKREKLKDA